MVKMEVAEYPELRNWWVSVTIEDESVFLREVGNVNQENG